MNVITRYETEAKYWKRGCKWVTGMDEVGRGSLAGPVVAAAVMFAPGWTVIEGIADSKALTAKRREAVFEKIVTQAAGWSVGWATQDEIDAQGIVAATAWSMRRALLGIAKYDLLLVDGNVRFDLGNDVETKYLIGGDKFCMSIAAASIVAKVIRDEWMQALHEMREEYNWRSNKGYGTSEHRAAIKLHGLCCWHRKSFGTKKGRSKDVVGSDGRTGYNR